MKTTLGLIWLVMGTMACRVTAVTAQEPEAQAVGRPLVLAKALEQAEVKDQVGRFNAIGARVFPTIGQVYKEGGLTYEDTLFLFVKDAAVFYRAYYLRLGDPEVPVLVIALPGALRELGLERLIKQ